MVLNKRRKTKEMKFMKIKNVKTNFLQIISIVLRKDI